jgi:hypothetical protein
MMGVALCKSVIADDISLVQAILHHIKITSKNVNKTMNFETYSFEIRFHIIPVSRDTYRLIIPHHMFTAKTTLRPNMNLVECGPL